MVRPTDQEMIIVEKLILIAPERSKDTPCHTGPHKVGGRQRELGELQESLIVVLFGVNGQGSVNRG